MQKLSTIMFGAVALFTFPAIANVEMKIFYADSCPHCHHARDFVKNHLVYEYPTLAVTQISVVEPDNRTAFQNVVKECGYQSGGVPIVTINGKCFQGYGSDDTTGQEFRATIDSALTVDERATAAGIKEKMAANPEQFKSDNAARLDAISEKVGETQKKSEGSSLAFWVILGVLVAGIGFIMLRRKKK